MSRRIRKQDVVRRTGSHEVRTEYAEFRSGILPPPNELEKYEEMLPGITDRLLTTYEKQVAHRIELETKVVDSNISKSRLGQILGFIIIMVVLGIGVFLFIMKIPVGGFVALISALGTLLTAYFTSIHRQNSELSAKKHNVENQ